MGKLLLAFVLLAATSFIAIHAQETGDSKVMTKVSDTPHLYLKVKRAFVKSGFTVKDDMDSVTLTTNVSVKPHLGYTIIKARIGNDTVTVWGFYVNKNKNLREIEMAPGKYNKIMYFKGSWGWDLLKEIASDIDPKDISFSR